MSEPDYPGAAVTGRQVSPRGRSRWRFEVETTVRPDQATLRDRVQEAVGDEQTTGYLVEIALGEERPRSGDQGLPIDAARVVYADRLGRPLPAIQVAAIADPDATYGYRIREEIPAVRAFAGDVEPVAGPQPELRAVLEDAHGLDVPEPVADGGQDVLEAVGFDQEVDQKQIRRAAREANYQSPAAFLQEGARRLAGEILDEDGALECPHDDCERTFATVRERRGHLGSSEHALDVPEGEFWCGYCGYGPTSWRGVNAHHGSSSHDGDPVRLNESPDREALIAPEDRPDHQDPELLAELYEEYDGSITDLCRAHDFDVGRGRVRHYLIDFGIHEPTPQGAIEDDDDGPRHRDPEWLQERYDAADGNVSEMHRRLNVDIPYRTLLKNLKKFEIHDPEHSRESSRSQSVDDGSTGSRSDQAADDGTDLDIELEGLDHDDPEDLRLAYQVTDSIAAATNAFPDVSYATVRQRMIDHGVYSPDNYNSQTDTTSADQTEDTDGCQDNREDTTEFEDEPPIEWDFDSEWQTVAEQETTGNDRLVESNDVCPYCGEPYSGDGLCEACDNDIEEQQIGAGGTLGGSA